MQENSAVCEGIAKTFLYLCDQEQIPAALVVGSADGSELGVNDDMLHAWNLVSLEGSWFHIDPTFDLCQSQAVKANRYDYFCLSDEEMMRDHIFEKKVECVSNEKSYFCQTKCLIKNSSELRTYIQKRFAAGKRVFYFKIVADLRKMDKALDKAMMITQGTLTNIGWVYPYRYYYNKSQGIIYINLMK